MSFRPMLAAKEGEPRFPVLASPKLDGIRCLGLDGMAMSRSLKPIPNGHVQDMFTLRPWLQGLDGELIVGPSNHPNVYNATTSGVMSRDGSPEVKFYVFDRFDIQGGFEVRHQSIELPAGDGFAEIVPHKLIIDSWMLDKFEAHCIELGYEGIMYRDPIGPYKQGRSTAREGWLVKVKRFEDAEAVVVGVEELMHNDNVATTSELGLTKRSSHQAGKRASGMLGALVVERDGVRFNIGAGFTQAQRENYWTMRNLLPGRIVTFKFFPHGVKDAPRHPIFKGWRSVLDLGE